MSTLDTTVSMLEMLPENDVLDVQNYIIQNKMKRSNPFQQLSSEQILSELKQSRQQYENGQCQEMGEAIQEIREKYGL